MSTLKLNGDSLTLTSTDEIQTIVGNGGASIKINSLTDMNVDYVRDTNGNVTNINNGDQKILEWNSTENHFDVVDLIVSTQADLDLDYQYEIQNAPMIELQANSSHFSTEIRPHSQGAHHYLVLSGANPGNNRRTGIGFQQSAGGSDHYLGDMNFRKMGSEADDQFNLLWTDAADPRVTTSIFSATRGSDAFKINYNKLVNSGNEEFLTKSLTGEVNTGKINATIDASDTPNTVILNANHPIAGDTLHNHMQMVQNYGVNAVPDGATGLLTFAVKDDSMGTSELVGRLGGEYDTGGDHIFRLDAMDSSGNPTSYSFAHTGARMGAVVRMASYDTTSRNSLTAQNGDVIYNTDTQRFEFYQNSGWVYYSATSA